MPSLLQVMFRFDEESEVHDHLPRRPEVGERVTHRGELWVVAHVRFDGVSMVATCTRPEGGEERAATAPPFPR